MGARGAQAVGARGARDRRTLGRRAGGRWAQAGVQALGWAQAGLWDAQARHADAGGARHAGAGSGERGAWQGARPRRATG